MMYIDVYDDNNQLICTFDIEDNADWIDYLDWYEMQISMGRSFYEITKYQQED